MKITGMPETDFRLKRLPCPVCGTGSSLLFIWHDVVIYACHDVDYCNSVWIQEGKKVSKIMRNYRPTLAKVHNIEGLVKAVIRDLGLENDKTD